MYRVRIDVGSGSSDLEVTTQHVSLETVLCEHFAVAECSLTGVNLVLDEDGAAVFQLGVRLGDKGPLVFGTVRVQEIAEVPA